MLPGAGRACATGPASRSGGGDARAPRHAPDLPPRRRVRRTPLAGDSRVRVITARAFPGRGDDAMDDLDRMLRRLVQALRTGFPEYLTRPFEVGELYQRIIPYRHNRRELGLDTNGDYELVLTRLLAGERGYVVGDQQLQEAMRQELASTNPDTSAFRGWADARVRITEEGLRQADIPGASMDDVRLSPRAAGAPPELAGAASPPPPIAPPSTPAPAPATAPVTETASFRP